MIDSALYRWSHPKRILVATNLLDGPSVMLHAVQQAKISHAEILLVHVIRPAQFRVGRDSEQPFVLPGPALRAAQAALNQLTCTFEREGILCEPIILKGNPVDQISLLVKDRDVDRVIVASEVHRGIERLLIGSLAEELAGTLDIPVCIVGHRACYQGEHTRPKVLVATSFRPGSSLCARFGAELAKASGGSLTLLHVMETRPADPAACRHARRDVFQKLRNSLGEDEAAELKLRLEVRGGYPAAEILEASRSPQHDLIILGSPAESLVIRIMGSSVIHQILGEANCPVLIVKPGESVTRSLTHQLLHSDPISLEPGLHR